MPHTTKTAALLPTACYALGLALALASCGQPVGPAAALGASVPVQTTPGEVRLATEIPASLRALKAEFGSGLRAQSVLTVTNTNDAGPGSLRQALLDAAPGDTVTFAPNLSGAEIHVKSVMDLVKDNLTITAPTGGLTLDADDTGRLFVVASGVHVTLNGLTLRDANSGPVEYGGAVYNMGHLTLNDVTFDSNEGNSGIVYGTANTSLVVNGGRFIDNKVVYVGGAIASFGSVTVDRVTFANNKAFAAGAIYTQEPGAKLIMTRSTVSGNAIDYFGGGVYLNGGTGVVRSSTISGNTAPNGAGVFLQHTAATFENVTIAYNSASGRGGGLFVWFDSSAQVKNSILAGNTHTHPTSPDFSIGGGGSAVSTGFNVIGNGTNAGVTFLSSDQVGTSAAPLNAIIAPLQDNGGPTKTHLPLGGFAPSPAIDGGECGGELQDQRGVARPQGQKCDVGAVEAALTTNFSGFFNGPVAVPAMNTAMTPFIYLWFSLGGDQGKDIYAAGFPAYRAIDCVSKLPLGGWVSATVGNPTTYDTFTKRYGVPLTMGAWTPGCRELAVRLRDGQIRSAYYQKF